MKLIIHHRLCWKTSAFPLCGPASVKLPILRAEQKYLLFASERIPKRGRGAELPGTFHSPDSCTRDVREVFWCRWETQSAGRAGGPGAAWGKSVQENRSNGEQDLPDFQQFPEISETDSVQITAAPCLPLSTESEQAALCVYLLSGPNPLPPSYRPSNFQSPFLFR